MCVFCQTLLKSSITKNSHGPTLNLNLSLEASAGLSSCRAGLGPVLLLLPSSLNVGRADKHVETGTGAASSFSFFFLVFLLQPLTVSVSS